MKKSARAAWFVVPLLVAAPISADWQSSVTAEIARSEYRFSRRADGAVAAPNRAHNLRSAVTPDGLELTARVEGESRFKLTLKLIGQGRGKRSVPVGTGTLTQDAVGAAIVRGPIREWYVNDDRGLEQGFTLASRPRGSKGWADLEMSLGGDVLAYPDPSGQSIVFKNANGEPVLRYGELLVVDANKRALPARMVVRPGVLRIEFDDKAAAYPVTVDPLATSPAWAVESNQASAQFGFSVATAGDVNGDGYSDVVVGAWLYDNGQFDEGRSFVYHGSAAGLSTSPAWTAEGDQANATFGFSVATAGDVNGDGYADVVVGARQYSNGEPEEGGAFAYYGSAAGNQQSAGLGSSVATAGDVNGDGFAEVIVGAWQYDSNASQDDMDADTVGDACDTDPRFSVSNNVTDPRDFTTIQAAVNAAAQSGTRIRIFPGTGPYLENVIVDRNFVFIFEGVDDVSNTPVEVDGDDGIAFDVVTTSAGGRVSFDNLTLRGATGIRSAVSTAMEDLTFELATALAVDLNGGTHTLERIRMGSTVGSGIDTASGVPLTLRNSRFESLSGTALRLGGPSTVETVLVGGGAGDAAVVLSGASLSLRHATIAGNGGKGVDNSAGGTTTIAHAIAQDNAGGDVANVTCSSIVWSNVKSQDCTATGNDLRTTCALAGDFRQLVSSPCLDYGPSPATFTGSPCLDLDNGPRLRDHDGDGLATIDPGAFERENVTLTPGNVPNLRFTSKTTLAWDAEPSGLATEYHVYRDLKANLSYGNFGVCRDELDVNRTDLVLTDDSTPAPGQSFVYIIAAGRPAAGSQPDREGTMGLDRCMERSNFNACP